MASNILGGRKSTDVQMDSRSTISLESGRVVDAGLRPIDAMEVRISMVVFFFGLVVHERR